MSAKKSTKQFRMFDRIIFDDAVVSVLYI